MRSCRICAGRLTPFFDMGSQPLANGLLSSPDQPENRYPLCVCLCATCGLVQLSEVVPAEVLYKDYPFQTGSSKRMVEHFAKLFNAYPDKRIIEIGGNDSAGWLNAKVKSDYLNIDPVGNDCLSRQEQFSEAVAIDVANSPQDGPAHLIVACNVLGHVDDLHDFMRGVKHLLHPDGAFIFEVPYFANTLHRTDYAQCYHEHLSYFTLQPLNLLLHEHGMHMHKIEHFDVHGGSIRITAKHGHDTPRAVTDEIANELYKEVFSLSALNKFAYAARDRRAGLLSVLDAKRMVGKRIVGYCASAKGAVVLNWCGITHEIVSVVADSTPSKQHRYMPGTRQLIRHPEHLFAWGDEHKQDAILLLSPNHADEIKAKHPEFKGEWIMP